MGRAETPPTLGALAADPSPAALRPQSSPPGRGARLQVRPPLCGTDSPTPSERAEGRPQRRGSVCTPRRGRGLPSRGVGGLAPAPPHSRCAAGSSPRQGCAPALQPGLPFPHYWPTCAWRGRGCTNLEAPAAGGGVLDVQAKPPASTPPPPRPALPPPSRRFRRIDLGIIEPPPPGGAGRPVLGVWRALRRCSRPAPPAPAPAPSRSLSPLARLPGSPVGPGAVRGGGAALPQAAPRSPSSLEDRTPPVLPFRFTPHPWSWSVCGPVGFWPQFPSR